jgi:hypothetical protein
MVTIPTPTAGYISSNEKNISRSSDSDGIQRK